MYAYGLIHNQGRLRNGVLHDYMRAVDSVQFIIVFFTPTATNLRLVYNVW